jgi:hypothetical protein
MVIRLVPGLSLAAIALAWLPSFAFVLTLEGGNWVQVQNRRGAVREYSDTCSSSMAALIWPVAFGSARRIRQ